MSDHDRHDPGPADRRLDHLLGELAGDPSAAPPRALVSDVVRTARWQRAVRGSLVALSDLSAAAADLAVLLVRDEGRRR